MNHMVDMGGGHKEVISTEQSQRDLKEKIIARWTESYPPADDDDMFVLRLSSYEIAEILGEFVTVEPGDVTRILLDRGYKLVRSGEGDIKWLIKKGE